MDLPLVPLLLIAFCPYVLCQYTCPIVSAPIGKYQGSILFNSYGDPIFSFRGIRYAEPPINELRFQPPVPIRTHAGIYDAKEDAPVCPQITKLPVSEDCLFLNVFTTKLPEGPRNPKRPVLVYLHYGGYYYSTGRSTTVGPQYLMNQEIVLVTLNYRLGTLGFLSTGDREAIGNNGLKDQVAALRWIRANIAAFGGDPDNVTLYGYSAGAISISLHLVSPMSKGLFHRAIMSSSSALGNYPVGKNLLAVTRRQAEAVGCPSDTTANMVNCLRQTPAEELGNSFAILSEIENIPGLLWKPVVEENYGQERFLPDHPVKMIREGKLHNVPVLAGFTRNEFAFIAPVLLRYNKFLRLLNSDFDKYAPILFLYERDTPRSKAISRALKSFYFNNRQIDNSSEVQLGQLLDDAGIGYSVNRAVKIISKYNKQPVYYYHYSYKSPYSFAYLPGSNGTIPYGVAHQDDMLYLFYMQFVAPEFGIHDTEFKMVDKMTSLWSNFAKYGKPIVEKCGKFDYADWLPYNSRTQKYLDIGQTLQLKDHIYENRFSTWDQVFPESDAVDRVLDIDY